MEETELVEAARGGDRGAMAVLAERYRRLVYAVGYKITLNEEDALDVMQATFVKMIDRLPGYAGRGAFKAWLTAIAAREAVDRLRGRGRRETATDPAVLGEMCDERQEGAWREDPRPGMDAATRRERVVVAMADLAPQQRAILLLRLNESLGPSEIAERLGMPAVQVRSQMFRAIGKLKQILCVGDVETSKEGRR